MKTFDDIYGSFVNISFVKKMLLASKEAHKRAKLNLALKVNRNLHDKTILYTQNAIKHHSEMIILCNAWIKENTNATIQNR